MLGPYRLNKLPFETVCVSSIMSTPNSGLAVSEGSECGRAGILSGVEENPLNRLSLCQSQRKNQGGSRASCRTLVYMNFALNAQVGLTRGHLARIQDM